MIYFQYPLVPLLSLPIFILIVHYLKPEGMWNIVHVASKIVIVLIILLAIASPYTVEERQGLTGSKDITLIADNSESMRIFNASAKNEIYDYLINWTSVNIDTISGTGSCIGDHVVKNIRSGGSMLLISDGNDNCGRGLPEAINFARNLNSTVYLLKQEPIKKDIGITISSDPLAVVDSPAYFHMDAKEIGGIEGDLEVQVDNVIAYTGHISRSGRSTMEFRFSTQGSHTVRAEIFTGNEDAISLNNVFYRSVQVIPRPRILLVSKKSSPLSQLIEQIYSVDVSRDLHDLTQYDAIVLDDMNANELSVADSVLLSDYVGGGGGLVVIGGVNSFTEDSVRPLFEQLLPVNVGGKPQTGKSAGIVVVVDISGSTGELYGTDPKLGVEKGLAIQMLNNIGPLDFLGVIAFNNAAHVIVPFKRYQELSGVTDTIAQLRYGGTTSLTPALEAAHNSLRDFDGGRNVIVISDGMVGDSEKALKAASSMLNDGVNIYAIGVGGNTDVDFMKKLAAAGGGGYLRRDQAQGIELLFREMKSKAKRDVFPLIIINSGHFITKDLTINVSVHGYNNVFTKQNAQALIKTSEGNPVLNTWRFGLGRVVSISVDNGNNWAPELYDAMNSKVISTSINYAIGNPVDFMAQDGERGEPVAIHVQSDVEPDIRYDGERILFERRGNRLYSAEIFMNSTGFHDLSGYRIAVNEPAEYRELGNNDLISEVIAASGGHVYNMSEIEMLIPDIKNKNTGIVSEAIDLRPILIFAAMILYSLEVIIRRMFDVLK
ncbi:MAG TPA: vWA domain-containing protein [candidate division Zixibacteria bacterium]|nr:vWA domain-containing protein [candidate division Zixibacteria bacterium]